MNYWLVKSEPSVWSWDQQVAKGAKGEAWTGVRNFTARQNLVAMKKGDKAFFYHSNEGKEIVGIAEIIKEAYPDPSDKTGKFVCVDIKADKPLEDAGDDGRDQGRQEVRRHGAGEIFAAVGAAGDGGRVEDGLQDGRNVATLLRREGKAQRAHPSRPKLLERWWARYALPTLRLRPYAATAVTTCASSASRFDCVR